MNTWDTLKLVDHHRKRRLVQDYFYYVGVLDRIDITKSDSVPLLRSLSRVCDELIKFHPADEDS